MGFWRKVKAFFTGKTETQIIRENAAKRASKTVQRERPELPRERERELPPSPGMPQGDIHDYIDETVIDDHISWSQKVADLQLIWEDRNMPDAVKRDAFEEWWTLVGETFTPIEDFDWDGFREYYAETMPSGPAHAQRGH